MCGTGPSPERSLSFESSAAQHVRISDDDAGVDLLYLVRNGSSWNRKAVCPCVRVRVFDVSPCLYFPCVPHWRLKPIGGQKGNSHPRFTISSSHIGNIGVGRLIINGGSSQVSDEKSGELGAEEAGNFHNSKVHVQLSRKQLALSWWVRCSMRDVYLGGGGLCRLGVPK